MQNGRARATNFNLAFAAFFLFSWTVWQAFGDSQGPADLVLRARDAQTQGEVRFFPDPERLGFPTLDGTACWRLPALVEGSYDIDVTYSSGQGLSAQRAGAVMLMIGDKSYNLSVLATGAWGTSRVITIKQVPMMTSDQVLGVRVVERAPGIETVLDLWQIRIVPSNAAFPETGKVLLKQSDHGTFLQYAPRSIKEPIRILVVVHGTPGDNETEAVCAENFLQLFRDASERQGAIMVAPVFDTPNFGGREGPGGGYRGLFGRHVRADKFLNEILAQYQETFPNYDGRIYLYGHSAGGQFVSRYIVMNPQRIISAVISSAGTFAFPDPELPWSDGMASLKTSWRWPGDQDPREVNIQPDPEGWLQASSLAVTVLAGGLERERNVPNPERKGSTVVERSQIWVDDMHALARKHGKTSKIRFILVEGVGHDGGKLAQTGLKNLFAASP